MSMNHEDSLERLWEELTLEKVTRPGDSPPFGGFGGNHHRWSNWSWNSGGIDCVYLNKEGKMHRIYGPAYISTKHGIEKWYKEGELHRIGGPAVKHAITFLWYKEGKLHNLDGPAIIDPAGPCQYWIDGVKYSKKQYKWEIQRRQKNRH